MFLELPSSINEESYLYQKLREMDKLSQSFKIRIAPNNVYDDSKPTTHADNIYYWWYSIWLVEQEKPCLPDIDTDLGRWFLRTYGVGQRHKGRCVA